MDSLSQKDPIPAPHRRFAAHWVKGVVVLVLMLLTLVLFLLPVLVLRV